MDKGIMNLAHIKASLLANGLQMTDRFLTNYKPPLLIKRRAYGNSDSEHYFNQEIPQEVVLDESGIVCGIHARSESSWILDYDERFFLSKNNTHILDVNFPRIPKFYDFCLSSGKKGNTIGTLYGGQSLGIFVYGSCALVDNNQACQYCSISPNRLKQNEFAQIVKIKDVYDIVKYALNEDSNIISQIMINGGNFRDRDKGFSYYLKICEAARRAINDCKRSEDVELHLIIFPPESLNLIDHLADFEVCVAMNTEVFDEQLFAKYCPGKLEIGGHRIIHESLDRAVNVLGEGNVFSIFVGGLESIESLNRGLLHSLSRGIVPIVNVFHADPDTPLEFHPIPDTKSVIEIGKILQEAYLMHNFSRPFYESCGRNALDTEAHRGMF